MPIYTKRGDDGTTGQLYGGRVAKDAPGPEADGAVDEAVSALGAARALAEGELAAEILGLQRQLFVVGAELGTAPENRDKLEPGVSLVTPAMVEALEARIDRVVDEVGTPTEFVVPGEDVVAAAFDVARSAVRRAERRAVTWASDAGIDDSQVVAYLNRLADYLYMLARSVEEEWTPSREEKDD